MYMQGTFDSYVFKVSLRSIGVFAIYNNLVSRKRLVEKGNDENFGSGVSFHVYIHGTFQGHSEVIRCMSDFSRFSTTLIACRKTVTRRVKHLDLWGN